MYTFRKLTDSELERAYDAVFREAFPPEELKPLASIRAMTAGGFYRRLGFYRRSGAVTLGYDSALFGVHYKTIVWARGEVDEAEVLRRHAGMYRRWFTPEMYAKAIQIPLAQGEKPFDRAIWDERPESEEKQ